MQAGSWALSTGCNQQVGLLQRSAKNTSRPDMQGQLSLFGTLVESSPPFKATRVTSFSLFKFILLHYLCCRVGRAERAARGRSRQVAVWACGCGNAGPAPETSPPKKWLFASETFIKPSTRRGSASPPGLLKEASKTQVVLCKVHAPKRG